MAILGKIRQRSIFLILVIGMALFAFVISGVFDGSASNTGPTDPIALINDEEVELDFFRQMVEQTERSYSYSTLQSVNLVWNQALRNTVFDQQFEKLGIDAGRDQLEQIISSDDNLINNPNFQNEAGFFDFGIFTDYISQLKSSNPTAYENWKLQEQSIIGIAKQRIYLDLIMASAGMTEAEAKANYHLENDNVTIQYVQIPFDVIPDSLVEVTDAEIKKYIQEHKEEFKREETRNIQYVAFDESPTEDDLATIRLRLDGLKSQRIAYNDVSKLTDTLEGFKETRNVADFVDQYSEVSFDSVYKPRGEYNNEYADILFGLDQGEVFGPYRDGNTFKISRLLDRKKNASIRASHILISYEGATRANPEITRSKEEAKKEANRVYRLARRASSDFEALAFEYSDGPTKTRGGDLGFFQEGEMATEFFNFVNTNKVNRVGLVETEFGFHIIKVTDKDDLALIADVVAQAVPSDDTSNEIFRMATQFEMDSNEQKDFLGIAEKGNYQVRPVQQIAVLEENLPGLPRQRNIVRWAFEKDTKVGDIRRFSLTQGGYAVVQLTAKVKEGIASVEEVGAEVRKILVENKKAALIKKRYADKTTLESLAEAEDLTIETASAVNQKNPTIVGAGNEPKVVGTAFAMNEGELSDLVQGDKGVYKILLNQKSVVEDLEDYSEYSKQIQENASITLMENIFAALESVADIEDNRSLYY
ncbi:peptidylprolyl isomerase [Flavobacteriaceae bacterium]|jgi:peptidyl-prolyl cis-trans isomerase D|nr:peptidylprolyl isomerase [Flavobacteriaceae bacterium]MDA9851313.1 peptidylprolyl isomerase [Flavobacteriaceae bacterium]